MDYAHKPPEEMSREEMERLLRKARYGRLGLAFENESYVVPVTHIFDGESVWFTIGMEGKKTTYLQANPQACFQVDEWTTSGWGSVICYGTVALSDSDDSKREFLKLATGETPSDPQLHQMVVYVCFLTLEEMTGRKSPGYVA